MDNFLQLYNILDIKLSKIFDNIKSEEIMDIKYVENTEIIEDINNYTYLDIKLSNSCISVEENLDIKVSKYDSNIENNLDIKVSKNNKLDKFYTNKNISKKYVNTISEFYDWNLFDFVIEPSAGSGSFLFEIPNENKIGIDIEPEHNIIKKQDFFTYFPPEGKQNILTIGNPPFGRVGSLAVKFFNHAAKFSKTIAFIVPRSFRKVAIQNRLDLNFYLVYDDTIPIKPCCFNPEMKAKCCFQIWKYKDKKRNIIKTSLIHEDWDFIHFKEISNADFAIRAYGGHCGDIIETNLDKLNHKGWHFIKANINKELLIQKIKKLNFIHSTNTARQDSIGKRELVNLYNLSN